MGQLSKWLCDTRLKRDQSLLKELNTLFFGGECDHFFLIDRDSLIDLWFLGPAFIFKNARIIRINKTRTFSNWEESFDLYNI